MTSALQSSDSETPVTSQDFFSAHGYVLLPSFLSEEVCALYTERLNQLEECETVHFGRSYTDKMVPNAYATFGQFDCGLNVYRQRIAHLIGESDLVCMNSYARIYRSGATLAPHVDRAELELSCTVCTARTEIDWMLGVTDQNGKSVEVNLQRGDMLIVRSNLVHWRVGPYLGTRQHQVFFHYQFQRSDHSSTSRFSGRQCLGPELRQGSPTVRGVLAKHYRNVRAMVKCRIRL